MGRTDFKSDGTRETCPVGSTPTLFRHRPATKASASPPPPPMPPRPSPRALSGPPGTVATDIVLVGGGHSHVAVLKRFGMRPAAGVRLTLVSRDLLTPYSGMLPGLVAGHYRPEETHIDLRKLSRFANARVIHAPATGIDLARRQVFAAGRPPIGFDLLSLDVGSQPTVRDIEGAKEHALAVKPIDLFRERWAEAERDCLGRGGRLRVAVIGGGAGGAELALSLRYRLRTLLTQAGVSDGIELVLLAETREVVESHAPAVRRRMTRLLAERGVQLLAGHRVVAVRSGRVEAVTAGEERVAVGCDLAVAVTHACAPEWLGGSGLDLDDAGFVRVRETLQSTGDPFVFAAGDIASFDTRRLPKSGVYAVRQGPVLAENLARLAAGRPLRPYRPQPLTLALISSGDRNAVASWGRLALEGRWVWRIKDRIDRRWMRKYQKLPAMAGGSPPLPRTEAPAAGNAAAAGNGAAAGNAAPAEAAAPAGRATSAETSPAGAGSAHGGGGARRPGGLRRAVGVHPAAELAAASAMRCGGCGSKVASAVLHRVLGRLAPVAHPDVLIGFQGGDDAAVLRVPPDKLLVQSVDHFRTFIDDPFLFGRIAAHHCLSDLFAMGAEPRTAQAMVTLPFALPDKVEQDLFDLLSGVTETLSEAGAALVGGHTAEGPECALGLTVNGLCDTPFLKAGAADGDRLLLTKPLGTGVIFAADMRAEAPSETVGAALASMLRSNSAAARTFRDCGATACTDVTGFGLLGHLVELLRASGANAELDLAAIPRLPGTDALLERGVRSSLHAANAAFGAALDGLDPGDPRAALLFDPQTSGGLLASVPAERVDECTSALAAAGCGSAARVGTVRSADPAGRVRIRHRRAAT